MARASRQSSSTVHTAAADAVQRRMDERRLWEPTGSIGAGVAAIEEATRHDEPHCVGMSSTAGERLRRGESAAATERSSQTLRSKQGVAESKVRLSRCITTESQHPAKCMHSASVVRSQTSSKGGERQWSHDAMAPLVCGAIRLCGMLCVHPRSVVVPCAVRQLAASSALLCSPRSAPLRSARCSALRSLQTSAHKR